MSSDPQVTELDSSWGTPGSPDHQLQEPEDPDPGALWVPSGRRLLSGLLGLNAVLLGAALVAGRAFNSEGLRHDEPQLFMLLLMGIGLLWMLWYLLWARKQPDMCPHKDHHAGGITVTCELPPVLTDDLCFGWCKGIFVLSLLQRSSCSLLCSAWCCTSS